MVFRPLTLVRLFSADDSDRYFEKKRSNQENRSFSQHQICQATYIYKLSSDLLTELNKYLYIYLKASNVHVLWIPSSLIYSSLLGPEVICPLSHIISVHLYIICIFFLLSFLLIKCSSCASLLPFTEKQSQKGSSIFVNSI